MTLSRINHLGAAAPTTLTASITATDTTLSLASGTGYPTANFVIKVDAGTSAEEKILVGARSGTSCSSLTRGYDGTTAASHSSGATVEHDLAAVVIDDANDHIYTTSRDDHPQYARTDGTRAVTGAQTFDNGITVSAGGAAVTGASTFSSTVQATAHIATMSGTGRYVGSTAGAPTTGTYNTGDFANDSTDGNIWQCTAGGTPGTWAPLLPDTGWVAPVYGTGWSGAAGTGYRRIGSVVYMRGEVTGGASGTEAFGVGASFYPPYTIYLPVIGIDASRDYVEITAAGAVTPYFSSGTGVYLDGVVYPVN